MMEVGVDEAGRGALLGPLVVAVARVPSEKVVEVATLARDSKAFKSHEARLAALEKILEIPGVEVAAISAQATEVDLAVSTCGLNALERQLAARLLARPQFTGPRNLVFDGHNIFQSLAFSLGGSAVNKADSTHVAVAVASMVAKTTRDKEFSALCGKHGLPTRGGGYPNALTREAVRCYVQTHGEEPPFLRKTWSKSKN